MASITILNANIADTVTDFRALVCALKAVAQAEGADLTRQTLQHIDADLSSTQADIADYRATLDGQQVTEALIIERGDLYLAAWSWERSMRRQMVLLLRSMAIVRQTVADLANGLADQRHVVRRGETLQSIAQQYLGDWREWTRLLDVNDIDPAVPLAPGTDLTIPNKR